MEQKQPQQQQSQQQQQKAMKPVAPNLKQIKQQQQQNMQFSMKNLRSQGVLLSHQSDGINSNDNTPLSYNSHNNEGVSPFRNNNPKLKKITGSTASHGHSELGGLQSHKNLDQIAEKEEIEKKQHKLQQDVILAKRFKLSLNLEHKKNKIGLFIGRDQLLNQDVAIKLFGGKKPKISKSQFQFFTQEREILQKLRSHDGFSKMIDSGYEEDSDLYYIIMHKLDEDLNTVVKKSEEGKLSLQTVINIGLELISRLETLHELGIVHRDLKPKNIMLNYKQNEIVLIDFGLSNKFMSQYQTHIQYRSTKKILGTPLYASNNALLGKEISRRDDIESLVYILIFALKGTLPWKGQLKLDFLKSPTAKHKIHEWRNPYGELCQDIEHEFREMLEYAQKLEFDEEPDYEYLESLLSVIKERNEFDDTYDWQKIDKKPKQTQIIVQDEDKNEENQEEHHMIKELSQSLKKNVKYRTVRKLKKGTSGTYNNKNEIDLTITKQHSNNAAKSDSNQNQDSHLKQNHLKVKRTQHSKKRVKVSGKFDKSLLLLSPNISQTPDITKINSNDISNNVSNNVSHNGDISLAADKSPNISDNQFSSQQLQFQHCDHVKLNFQNDEQNNQDFLNSQGEEDLNIPSEDQDDNAYFHIINNKNFGNCSGTAGIDFDNNLSNHLQQQWDQESFEEGNDSMRRNVIPEFNNKRTIIHQRNSEIFKLENKDQSPTIRLNKLNSCNDISKQSNSTIQIERCDDIQQ